MFAPRTNCAPRTKDQLGGKRRVRTMSCDNRQLFQTWPPRNQVTHYDVRDCLDACSKLKDSDKKDYMYSLGIDYDRINKYYGIVTNLDQLFSKM